MRNFDYLKHINPVQELYKYCNKAEIYQKSDPETSAINSRHALELLTHDIYAALGIEIGPRATLLELVQGEPFEDFIGDTQLLKAVHFVRKAGNRAAHTGTATKKESFFALLNIYNIVGASLVKLSIIESYPQFDEQLLGTTVPLYDEPAEHVPETSEMSTAVDADRIKAQPLQVHPINISEAETRRLYIDLMLKESGWEVSDKDGVITPGKAGIEIEVNGMPTEKGIGYADYVLYGKDGKPLAVVEAKRTSVDPKKGRHQAELYAKCLKKQYGVMPVIYYSNGFHTEIIDGLGYPSRTVYAFHTADELELLIQKRKRKDIKDLQINDDITNREYQKRAVRHVCDRLNQKQRRALLIMATGTGKTRVSISIVDVLQRNGWVKNVLFLADRTPLVKQAAKNYAKLLPGYNTCILSEDKKPDMTARIMFSTYQTMINYIDSDTKHFPIGRFDLIIIDEAHRSVFGKYVGIFEYFDSFLIGLTATPREDLDKNTFDLFNTEAEDAFAYELTEAVNDGFLVDYNPLKRGTVILKEGITYDKLTKEQKRQFDDVWKYEKARKLLDDKEQYSRDINSTEIFNYIFNVDTVDKVLQDLMTNGLMIHSGETIGKTIIFAYNHDHALLVEERFKALYPSYGEEFIRVIDNYEKYSQNLIETFEVRDKLPQIAVSVDMLDTGIDVPDILNLVFFKPVRSYIKFMQMIGRGTRLSENIFGPGMDKKIFNIYDWCSNFAFFGKNKTGVESSSAVSLTERLFCLRTDIAAALQDVRYQKDDFARKMHDDLKTALHGEVMQLNHSHMAVKMNLETVEYFSRKDSWTYLSPIDVLSLKDCIAPILVKKQTDEKAKQFDCLLLDIMLARISSAEGSERNIRRVIHLSELLQKKASIPQVMQKMDVILEASSEQFWDSASLSAIERIRTELRELMMFITGYKKMIFQVDIEDEINETGVAEHVTPLSYKKRIDEYLEQNASMPAFRKIFNMEQLTHDDIVALENIMWKELGTIDDYHKYVQNGNMICGDSVAVFIRSIIGIDRQKALEKYSAFLSTQVLNADQEQYIKRIIEYVCVNGDITMEKVLNGDVFTTSTEDLITVFGSDALNLKKYVDELHNAVVA